MNSYTIKERAEKMMWEAMSHVELGNLIEAELLMSEALTLTPNDSEIYCARGLLYLKLNHVDIAINNFLNAIRFNPTKSVFHFNLGCAFFTNKRYQEAIFSFSDSIDLNHEDSDSYSNRGNCYLNLNNYEKAKKDYEVALSMNPADNIAKRGLILIAVKGLDGKAFKGEMFTNWVYDYSNSLEELEKSELPFSMACFEIYDNVIVAIGMDRRNQSPKDFIEENQNCYFILDITKVPRVIKTSLDNKIAYSAKRFNETL